MAERELTPEQEAAAQKFVEAHEVYVTETERLRQERFAALETALDAGVIGVILAERTGLAVSRLYQMQDELRKAAAAKKRPAKKVAKKATKKAPAKKAPAKKTTKRGAKK